MSEVPYRWKIKEAVSWALIYQIMRRYHAAYELRLWETHPGGGQYDCLSIWSRRPNDIQNHGYGTHIFDFNLGPGSLWIHRDVNLHSVQRRLDIVDDYMANDPKKLLDSICMIAGFKKQSHIPRATGPVVTIGVMAFILQSYIFSQEDLTYYMGYIDASGDGGGLRSELGLFKETKAVLENNDVKGAYKYFYLKNMTKRDIKCLFDMRGKVFFRDDSEMDLLPAYVKNGRKINRLATAILEKVNL